MGREPMLVGDEKVGYATSANYGFAVDRSIAYGYLPVALAKPGQRVDLQYFGVRYAATVAEEPLYDPTNARLKGPAGSTTPNASSNGGRTVTPERSTAGRVGAPTAS